MLNVYILNINLDFLQFYIYCVVNNILMHEYWWFYDAIKVSKRGSFQLIDEYFCYYKLNTQKHLVGWYEPFKVLQSSLDSNFEMFIRVFKWRACKTTWSIVFSTLTSIN